MKGENTRYHLHLKAVSSYPVTWTTPSFPTINTFRNAALRLPSIPHTISDLSAANHSLCKDSVSTPPSHSIIYIQIIVYDLQRFLSMYFSHLFLIFIYYGITKGYMYKGVFMKDYSFLVLSGDDRQLALYDYLNANDCDCVYYDASEFSLKTLVKTCKVILCPTPFTKNNETIHQTSSIKREAVSIEDFLKVLSSDNIVIGYGFNENLKNNFNLKNIRYIDMSDNSFFLRNNGILTAEGVLGSIITSTPFSLNKAACLITGFGNCGLHISDMLFRLGADITVFDIDDALISKALSFGFSTLDTLESVRLSSFDIIINTVPENIFTKNLNKYMNKSCYIYDIASAPFGFEDELIKDYKHYTRLPGIPGKLMSKSAGELIGKTVLMILKDFERK